MIEGELSGSWEQKSGSRGANNSRPEGPSEIKHQGMETSAAQSHFTKLPG